MSKNINQKGSVSLVIIIVLVLGLVGSLGYVAYDKFIVKAPVAEEEIVPAEEEQLSNSDIEEHDVDNETESETEEPADNTTTTTETNSDAKYIISQWGIKGVYNGSYTAQYEISYNSNGQTLVFNSREFISQSGKECNIVSLSRNSDKPAGVTSLANFDGITGEFYSGEELTYKHVGEYYYGYSFNRGTCSEAKSGETDYNIEQNLRTNLKYLFATLVAV